MDNSGRLRGAGLAAHHRIDVSAFGRATCFGFCAEVLAAGPVKVGDDVRIAG